jgi:hypothetical protein
MKTEEIKKMISELDKMNSLTNSELVSNMDKLSEEFETLKKRLIAETIYLDKVEELYNINLKEYKSRGL